MALPKDILWDVRLKLVQLFWMKCCNSEEFTEVWETIDTLWSAFRWPKTIKLNHQIIKKVSEHWSWKFKRDASDSLHLGIDLSLLSLGTHTVHRPCTCIAISWGCVLLRQRVIVSKSSFNKIEILGRFCVGLWIPIRLGRFLWIFCHFEIHLSERGIQIVVHIGVTGETLIFL